MAWIIMASLLENMQYNFVIRNGIAYCSFEWLA